MSVLSPAIVETPYSLIDENRGSITNADPNHVVVG